MNVVIFTTPIEKIKGLQYRPLIERDTLFVFPDVVPGTWFHSRNVREAFDIAFLDSKRVVLLCRTMMPPYDVIEAPAETALAVESKGGQMLYWGFIPGWKVNNF